MSRIAMSRITYFKNKELRFIVLYESLEWGGAGLQSVDSAVTLKRTTSVSWNKRGLQK